ncbi:DNA repair protein RecN [Tessaracoccus caeni]|uniref:DNA repair protein RecN n=1 Tax=Tessaracoccus caeni TaxID=3031239 RepID=UPI0023DB5B7F|nr:DNA repair protein RecN [Tessaracoccus caeni]MDF1488031.1 DNA repair protein RecN [Tessaracoccus caeni]
MLSELRLSAFGVVDEAVLELGPGLNALTGETGAGKTMIVSGLGHLLGARADSGIVRRGAERATVQGLWEVGPQTVEAVAELGGDTDGPELTTLRQVSAQGRSRAVVGGAAVPVSTMAALLGELATIHGQSEQVRLSSPERQRELLDAHARPAELARYRDAYRRRKAAAEELARLEAEADARTRESDMLRYGLGEVDGIAPQPGEDDQLAAEQHRLMDLDELRRLAGLAGGALSGPEDDLDVPGVASLVGQARKALTQLADLDPAAETLASRVEELQVLADDVAAEVASYAADLVADPLRLEAVGQRRAELATLTRKYGRTIDEVLAWADNGRRRLEELDGSDERIGELSTLIDRLDQELAVDAAAISAARRAAADELAGLVAAELRALAMPHARLRFDVTEAPIGPHGADRIELLFSANPGSDPAPLGKVASGGELSRVRLALEVVLAGDGGDHTFVFDEVDAGVGGAVGLEIGRRLRRLATRSQVIVVTHLAQVAAFADQHFVIAKASDGQITTSGVHKLDDAQREAELARMMGGSSDSAAALRHAAELRAEAANTSCNSAEIPGI